jgi:hypothetical protein
MTDSSGRAGWRRAGLPEQKLPVVYQLRMVRNLIQIKKLFY